MAKLLTVVKLNPMVEAFVKEHFEILTPSELTAADAAEIEVIMSNGGGKVSKELQDRLPNAKLIDNFGVGYDGADIDECQKRGIALCTTPGVLTDDVADLAIGLMLSLSRHICSGHAFVTSNRWQSGHKPALATKVSGKKAGIVGLGRIGRAVARRCEGFDMKVHYYDRHAVEPRYIKCETLEDLASCCDYLIICAAATAQNRHLISADIMRKLGPSGMLINIARGSLVDEKAAAALLKSGELGGAALDVFEDEPHVTPELLSLPNVVLTPHIASGTVETRALMAEIVIDNLKAFMAGTEYRTRLF